MICKCVWGSEWALPRGALRFHLAGDDYTEGGGQHYWRKRHLMASSVIVANQLTRCEPIHI